MMHSEETLSNVALGGNMICSATLCNVAWMDEIDLDTPGGRLKWARERASYQDAAEFAGAVKIKPVTYRAYENNQNGYAKHAPEFAELLGVTPKWLLHGGPSPSNDPPPRLLAARRETKRPISTSFDHVPTVKAEAGAISLRHVDMSLSMGDGSNLDDYFEEGVFEFDAALLRSISRAPAHRLIVGQGIGDSMMPTIHDQSLVIFDTTQTILNTTDKIWAISLFGAGGIKRLRPVARDRVLVISDNPMVPDQEVSTEDLRILGRVIWSARRH